MPQGFDATAIEPEAIQALPFAELLARSEAMTLAAHGPCVTYSRKVFIPLTRLCRDVCHYCTFATTPSRIDHPYLTREQVLEIARAGERAGCREALFTLGDLPEARYAAARDALDASGHASTLMYLAEMAAAVAAETSLLPHLNAGLIGADDLAVLRRCSVSMGIMLESVSDRLCAPGGPHHGSPDKLPAARLAALEAAGIAKVPMTTGLLIGIGETRGERIASLAAIRDLHARHGHIQEVIIQNFRAKPGTRMADHPEPSLDEHRWTVAAARLVLGGAMTIQAPPNLWEPEALPALLKAGVNDWGGVSPVTADHVNPEAPWPHLELLERATRAAGRRLHERLAIGPRHALRAETWLDKGMRARVLRAIDGRGLPRDELWAAGVSRSPPVMARAKAAGPSFALPNRTSDETEIVAMFRAGDGEAQTIAAAADRLRAETVGEAVTHVVNQNINYTNICLYRCGFCAFSKGSTKKLRGPAYRMDLDAIGRRAAEAVARGATEVCLQGGIHPDYDGETYLAILRAVRTAAPDVHIHAFSPLEIMHGATTLRMGLHDYLSRLRDAGLSTLPGTAAEILDPEVRAILCPDKLTADQWVEVMRTAHRIGLRSTATIMFGHVDEYRHWARHLLRVRTLQEETGGFTEFVPLPFVHPEAPIWQRGEARSGPSWREAMLMHAVARIVLHPVIPNIQTSWVKMGREGAAAMLRAGANDLGGTLMSESITSAAGGQHGREIGADELIAIARAAGRSSRQRTTLYGTPAPMKEDAWI